MNMRKFKKLYFEMIDAQFMVKMVRENPVGLKFAPGMVEQVEQGYAYCHHRFFEFLGRSERAERASILRRRKQASRVEALLNRHMRLIAETETKVK